MIANLAAISEMATRIVAGLSGSILAIIIIVLVIVHSKKNR